MRGDILDHARTCLARCLCERRALVGMEQMLGTVIESDASCGPQDTLGCVHEDPNSAFWPDCRTCLNNSRTDGNGRTCGRYSRLNKADRAFSSRAPTRAVASFPMKWGINRSAPSP